MHHIFNIEDTANFSNLVWTELKKCGIKETGRWRKPTKVNDLQKKGFFCKPLEVLDTEQVLIMIETELENLDGSSKIYAKGDILVEVPSLVVQLCQAILKSVQIEGLFRKAGSSGRQRDIRRQLEKGDGIKTSHDPIDLANILKQFLRELPEPLIPYPLHDVLLKCTQIENIEKAGQALHLTCLLIPPRALATLCYLLQFFEVVASNSSKNLMDANNLSIVMAPTLMPINISISRNDKQSCSKLQSSAKVIQMLIESSSRLCGIPRCLSSRLLSISTTSLIDHDRGRCNNRDKRRHRRSSSFNRVFEGLRKIVGVKSELSASAEQLSDFRAEASAENGPLASPIIMRSTVKRKVDLDLNLGLSSKKKKAVSDMIPQRRVLCTTPLTPQGNHRYEFNAAETHHSYFASPHIDLNPSPSGSHVNMENLRSNTGVLRFFNRKKAIGRMEDLNPVIKTPKLTKRRLSLGKKSSKKQLLQSIDQAQQLQNSEASQIDCHVESMAMVELSEIEPKLCDEKELASSKDGNNDDNYQAVYEHYEELKNQVKHLENDIINQRLRQLTPEPVDSEDAPLAEIVQSQYEKTLEEADKLLLERSASEQLARQLSRGLRIRRSAEQKVIRSPSARKIGAVRRRSRESPRGNTEVCGSSSSRRLTRSQSMLAIRRNPSVLIQQMLTPKRPIESVHSNTQEAKISLRRGKPNTIRTGLKDPTPMRAQSMNRGIRTPSSNDDETPRACKLRSSKAHDDDTADDELFAARRPVTRNGSVMRLAQNFISMTQTIPASSVVPVSPESVQQLRTPENIHHQWTSGEVFNRHLDHLRIPLSGRPSVQKIRSENHGKVSAHVRKFDGLASPTLQARVVNQTPGECIPTHMTMTPHRVKSPRQFASVQRQLSDPVIPKEKTTSNKIIQVSPLRESQRANALPQSSKADRHEIKIKAPLLTPGQGSITPFGFKVRTADVKVTRIPRKHSPLKATISQLRRSPRCNLTTK